MEYEELLKKAGFDDKETKVYLAALELRSASASTIAQKAGIVRSTCYGILEDLVYKGLASKTEKAGGILKFNVENPELLKSYIEGKKYNLDLISQEIEKILPELKKLQKESLFRPEVEYFEGKEGIKAAYESIMPDCRRMAKAKIPLLVHGATQPLLDAWPDFPKYALKRQKTGLETKMLLWVKKLPGPMKAIQEKYYKIRYLPKKYAYPGGTNILDNKILFVEFENNFTVIIKNKPLTEMMRIFFEFMWEHSK